MTQTLEGKGTLLIGLGMLIGLHAHGNWVLMLLFTVIAVVVNLFTREKAYRERRGK